MFSKLRIVYYTFIVFSLSSCFETKEITVTIVDKSFNKNAIHTPETTVGASYNKTTKMNNVEKRKDAQVIKKISGNNNANVAWAPPIKAQIHQGFSKSHQGVTFDSKENTKVGAIASGQVVYSGNNLKAYGYMVIIKHKYGFYSHYMFNDNSLVNVGDNIKQGQNIATTGKNKLYLSMKKFTTVVNPEKYISF